MPYELFLALRYLRSRHKRRLARATAVAAIIGIAMGVGALIVTLALSNGFRDEMRDKILQGTAHINVLRTDGYPLTDSELLKGRIRAVEGVLTASATTYDGAVARGPKGSAYAVLRGIEPEAAESMALQSWSFEGSGSVRSQPTSEPLVVLGVELANRLGAKTGDIIQVIPAELSNVATKRVRVSGIFRSGLFEYDSTWIYLPLETAISFSGDNHSASIISVQVKTPDEVKRVASQIRQTLGANYNTIDWQQANQPLFSALALERRMGLFIIGLIIAIHRCQHRMAQLQMLDCLGNPLRLILIDRPRLALGDRTLAAAACTHLAQQQEGGGAVVPAFADIRAARLFTDGMQALFAH